MSGFFGGTMTFPNFYEPSPHFAWIGVLLTTIYTIAWVGNLLHREWGEILSSLRWSWKEWRVLFVLDVGWILMVMFGYPGAAFGALGVVTEMVASPCADDLCANRTEYAILPIYGELLVSVSVFIPVGLVTLFGSMTLLSFLLDCSDKTDSVSH
jgi:hypothetical protein